MKDPLETSIHLHHNFKTNIATRIPEGHGRKPRRRPGSDPEVDTESGKRSSGYSQRFQEGFERIYMDSERFPEGSGKVPFMIGQEKKNNRDTLPFFFPPPPPGLDPS